MGEVLNQAVMCIRGNLQRGYRQKEISPFYIAKQIQAVAYVLSR